MTAALRMTQRRTMLLRTRATVEGSIARAVAASLARRFATLKRELRRGNLRKRLKKAGLSTYALVHAVLPPFEHMEERKEFYKVSGEMIVAALWKAGGEEWDGIGENPMKGPNGDWQPWIDQFTADLQDNMLAGVDQLFETEWAFWGTHGKQQVPWSREKTVEQYQTRVGRKIKDIGQETLTDTQQAIADWYSTEETLPDLIDTLSQFYSPARAEMIAATEATGLAAQVGGEMMDHFGISEWRWDAFDDACPICLDLNGETFDASDTDAYPPAHPNCRCGQFFLIPDDESLKFMPAAMTKRKAVAE